MKKILYKKIPAGIFSELQLKIDEVMDLLKPYLVSLIPLERQTLSNIGTECIEFFKVSYNIAVNNPDLIPAFIEPSSFKEELFTTNELWNFIKRIEKLKDAVYEMESLVGNYALETALEFYHTMQIAAKRDIPGTRVIYEELKAVFCHKKQKRDKKDKTADEGQLELFDNLDPMGSYSAF